MIVIRNVFRLKFGQAREAVAVAKEGLAIQKRVLTGVEHSSRLLTDVTGPFYTLVLELTGTQSVEFRILRAASLRRQGVAGELSEDGSARRFGLPRGVLGRRVGEGRRSRGGLASTRTGGGGGPSTRVARHERGPFGGASRMVTRPGLEPGTL